MKLLFSLLLSAASLTVSAQVLGPDVEKQVEESIRKRVEEDKARRMGPSHPLLKLEPLREQQERLVPEKPGVYALPQDGMPCIVPDTNGIAAIPNAAPRLYPYRKDMPTAPLGKRRLPDTK
jgi:hypothetical protein